MKTMTNFAGTPAGLLLAAVGTIAACGPWGLSARAAEGGSVSGTAAAKIQRPPTGLRLHLQLISRGKTLEDALAALKERREAVAAQLEKFGAEKASITFAAPVVGNAATPQQRRLEIVIAQRMKSRGEKVAKPVQPPATVTSLVTAQWPLEGNNPEKFLLLAETLGEKIKAADLAGAKQIEKLSPEEQELSEEMTESGGGSDPFSEGEATPAGQPVFLFVGKLSDKDRRAGMAEAFVKAKAQAAELAQAAGARLGSMTALSGSGGGGRMNYEGANPYANPTPYGRSQAYFLQRAMSSGEANGFQEEAITPSPDAVEFYFSVNVTFALEPANR